MIRTIVTTCGKEIQKASIDLDEISCWHMRNAHLGCEMLADGVYVEIADVRFDLWPNLPQ